MIKAIFPEGVTAMTVNGLHQWDYGQKLQIQASGLPALVEVHFASEGMKEAVVRSCAVTSNTLTAAIPDICLEQTSPILAWVYNVGASSGITVLTVTLPIIARARPQPNATIPEDTSDKYTEAVAAMNAAVNSVSTGSFTAARAIADESGNKIPDTYATRKEVHGKRLLTDIIEEVEKLVEAGVDGVYIYELGGPDYPQASFSNLPASSYAYSYATVYVYYMGARVYLWGNTWGDAPVYYRNYLSGEWDKWVKIVDSANIGNYEPEVATRARYTQASLNIVVTNYAPTPANVDVTFYHNGKKQTRTLNNIETDAKGECAVDADLGSYLSLSNDTNLFEYTENKLPLVVKSSDGAEGAYKNKMRFIVIGGDTARLDISGK